ncbi:hypothetical protein ABZ260_09120 [Streptosporangium sp. NPDC006013]|uniref:hypothetical protein n=1 Tax=Streptosporangium sp. NPDC006013 TaxID=3155596 RepID=UPI0033AC95A1
MNSAKTGKATKKLSVFSRIALALAGAMATVIIPSATVPSAAAASASALGCQSTYAVLTHANGNKSSWRCSGRYYTNVKASSFSAGGWSGTISAQGSNGLWFYRYFCDFNVINLSGIFVEYVELSATKAPHCS